MRMKYRNCSLEVLSYISPNFEEAVKQMMFGDRKKYLKALDDKCQFAVLVKDLTDLSHLATP